MGRRQRNNGGSMTTFRSRQSDCGRGVRKNANASTFQIHATNCTTKLHSHVHEARKNVCCKFQGTLQEQVNEWSFYTREALPLVWTRFLRLAKSSPKTARSPARRSRDGRATSGKTSGGISAQRPGNSRATAAAMPPSVRKDDSQDNVPCAGFGRAMSAPETGETTRLKSQP